MSNLARIVLAQATSQVSRDTDVVAIEVGQTSKDVHIWRPVGVQRMPKGPMGGSVGSVAVGGGVGTNCGPGLLNCGVNGGIDGIAPGGMRDCPAAGMDCVKTSASIRHATAG